MIFESLISRVAAELVGGGLPYVDNTLESSPEKIGLLQTFEAVLENTGS